jgi:hypothetical protein
VPSSDSAFAHRQAHFFINLIGAAVERSRLETTRAWIRDLYAQLSAHALPGKMPNFADGDDQDAITRFGKDHARRLEDLRRRYDPDGLFAARRHPDRGRISGA